MQCKWPAGTLALQRRKKNKEINRCDHPSLFVRLQSRIASAAALRCLLCILYRSRLFAERLINKVKGRESAIGVCFGEG